MQVRTGSAGISGLYTPADRRIFYPRLNAPGGAPSGDLSLRVAPLHSFPASLRQVFRHGGGEETFRFFRRETRQLTVRRAFLASRSFFFSIPVRWGPKQEPDPPGLIKQFTDHLNNER